MTASRQVLLIDDDDDVREIAQLSLEMLAGWNVLAASSGPEGVELAARERPDAILLDVMMPGMDGVTTYARLQGDARTRDIPVVLLTAKAGTADEARLRALGVTGLLTKPFDPMALAGEIADLVGWAT